MIQEDIVKLMENYKKSNIDLHNTITKLQEELPQKIIGAFTQANIFIGK